MHEYDWQLLNKKLDDFNERLSKVEKAVEELKPVPLKVNYTVHKSSLDLVGGDECKASLPYALSQGSLTDAGLTQTWAGVGDIKPIQNIGDFIHKSEDKE